MIFWFGWFNCQYLLEDIGELDGDGSGVPYGDPLGEFGGDVFGEIDGDDLGEHDGDCFSYLSSYM